MEPTPKVTAALTYPENMLKTHIGEFPNPINMKHTFLKPNPPHRDFTVGRNHAVGQLDHNLYKLQRVLEKTNYLKYNK